jgi:hypothetical protein
LTSVASSGLRLLYVCAVGCSCVYVHYCHQIAVLGLTTFMFPLVLIPFNSYLPSSQDMDPLLAPFGFFVFEVGFVCEFPLFLSVMYASNSIECKVSGWSSPSLVLRSCTTCSISCNASDRDVRFIPREILHDRLVQSVPDQQVETRQNTVFQHSQTLHGCCFWRKSIMAFKGMPQGV